VDIREKLTILAGSARYDVSCASSGSRRPSALPGARFGNAIAPGICHSFADDGRCISLLKVLFTNACVYDCAYCVNRRSADVPRASFTVRELVRLTEGFYRRNYIEGLFLSSGVAGSPDLTMELLVRTARTLRLESGFNGYIHLKVIPGASRELVREAGFWADRISANIELPSEASLRLLAPQKSGRDILSSMAGIREDIEVNRRESRLGRLLSVPASRGAGLREIAAPSLAAFPMPAPGRLPAKRIPRPTLESAAFAPAGQSTQLVVGASPESDRRILGLSELLYGRYRLRRVYYSALVPLSGDPRLPPISEPPLRREHRLYQADWLIRFYGFQAREITSEEEPFLDLELDPKSAWALRNYASFPVEADRADYETLLRVPGIGQRSAERIVKTRGYGSLSFDALKRIGVVLNRARYFLLCGGKSLEPRDLLPSDIRRRLRRQTGPEGDCGQLSLFPETARGGMGLPA
jgi:putative DNA modification/repair radical SAM protein